MWQFIQTELPESLRDYAQPLRTELLNSGGLLLLDGLDEVPEADHRREQVKVAVGHFAAAFPKVRILATSRIYAYQKQDWKLTGFAEAVLAPFSAAQIQRFVERWYAFVGPARRWSEADAQGRAVLLNEAIARSDRLHELATRPLLLTLMASLHAWRGGRLPEQREELYADAVDLLLNQWEEGKFSRREDGSYEIEQPSLVEWLQTDQEAVRRFLHRLAFSAHHDQPTLEGTADIAQTALVNGLLELAKTPNMQPQRLVEHLSNRAGLLEPRGEKVFAFPHRTFQEYLAACHLTEQDDFPQNVARLLRQEPNRWREVTLLAGAKATKGAAANAWALAEALCLDTPPEQKMKDERGYWGALLAAQVLIENKRLATVAEHNQEKVERIRGWLTRALRHGVLPPTDRADAGDALALVGDPRFRDDAWSLPDDELLGFREVPAGSFLMGEGKEQHSVTLSRYYIAKYPVTVAQFRAFMEQSGYQPKDRGSLVGLPNHPVRDVNWHEALAYCEWLTQQLRAGRNVPEAVARQARQEGWVVTLPSEAEWESAARGKDGLIYPWGNDWREDHANTSEAGIGRPSAVGSFPQGVSPCGCLDMAGNVWEWTRSLWGKEWDKPEFGYPYNPKDQRREELTASDNVRRVLRGGAFFHYQRLARCASRHRDFPSCVSDYVGFRVVVLTWFDATIVQRGIRPSGSRRIMAELVPGRVFGFGQTGRISTALHPRASLLVQGLLLRLRTLYVRPTDGMGEFAARVSTRSQRQA